LQYPIAADSPADRAGWAFFLTLGDRPPLLPTSIGSLISGRRPSRERLDNSDQFLVRGAGWIAEFLDWVSVHEPAQARQLADPLSPIELKLRGTEGEEKPPQFTTAE